jgi:hypothetical protein
LIDQNDRKLNSRSRRCGLWGTQAGRPKPFAPPRKVRNWRVVAEAGAAMRWVIKLCAGKRFVDGSHLLQLRDCQKRQINALARFCVVRVARGFGLYPRSVRRLPRNLKFISNINE